MKRTLLMAAFTILISAGLSAQNQGQGQGRRQGGQETEARRVPGNQGAQRGRAAVSDAAKGQRGSGRGKR